MFVFMMIINSMIPLMMIFFGFLWRKHPPSAINWAYGYRSSMSMKNNNAWKFAHKYQGLIWRYSGVALLLLSISFMIIFKNNYEEVSLWMNYISLAVLILSVVTTEIALRKRFDAKGEEKGNK